MKIVAEHIATKLSPPNVRHRSGSGAWLPQDVTAALCRLRLSPSSLWPVLLTVVVTQYRYGGKYAGLHIADIEAATGLSRSTVKRALRQLTKLGLVRRPQRTGRLVASVGQPKRTGGSMASPRMAQHAETSVISSTLSTSQRGGLTERQDAAVRRIMAEASELLGADAGQLMIPDTESGRLGLASGTTYEQAERVIRSTRNPRLSRDYVGAINRLLRDERIQGRDLGAAPWMGTQLNNYTGECDL